MANESSIWKKEISLGRRKPAAAAAESTESVWKKEIRLGRRDAPPAPHDEEWTPVKRTELWAESQPVAATEPVAEIAAAPVTVALEPPPRTELPPRSFAALDPKFRQVTLLAQLVEQRAAEYPARVDEWRKFLPRLAERAEDGVLPVELDGVVRTLFYELLLVGPNAPSGIEQTYGKPKRRRLERTKKSPEQVAKKKTEQVAKKSAEQVAKPAPSGLRRELHLPRPRLPKRSQAQPSEQPAPAKPKQSAEQSGLRRELHLPRPKLPKLSRGPRAERPEKPAKPAKPGKSGKSGKSAKPQRSGLRRDVHLSRPRLPRLDFSRFRGSGRSTQGTEKLVGLRIGSSQLAAALVHNNGSAELLQLARSPLERGVVVGGEVRDPEALARSLKAFFREHKLPQASVRLGISNNRIGVRTLEVPVIDDPVQFENAVRFRTQEVLPIPIAEAVIDRVELDDGPDADGQRRVLVVFAHKDLVDGYIDACRRAGLKLAGIDLDAFALLRALSEPPAAETEKRTALVAVAIGHERTIFAVSDGRICDFTRVLEWGGVWLDTALEKSLDLSPEEAAQIKHSLSLASDAPSAGLSPVQAEAARVALRHEVQVLGRELLSSLQFYQSRPGSLAIGEIVLSGGGAQLGGIDAELARALGVPVRLGDPFGRVTLGKNVVPPPESGSLAIAVGLAIEETR